MNVVMVDSFGDGFYAQGGDSHVQIPNEWAERHDPTRARPEWKPKYSPEPVYDGDVASGCHVRFNIHDAWLWRKHIVEPGAVRLTAMVMIHSNLKAQHGIQIGIHPEGGDSPFDGVVKWSPWIATHDAGFQNDEWVELMAEAVSITGLVTMFLRTRNDYAMDLAAAHFDLVTLYDTGDSPPNMSKADIEYILVRAQEIEAKCNELLAGMV